MKPQDQKRRGKPKAAQLYHVAAQKPVSMFAHLQQYEKQSYKHATPGLAEGRPRPQQQLIHPAVMALGLKFSEFIIVGGNARCVAMLTVFKRVIQEYTTPPGTTLSRHLTSYLSKQVDFLSNTRSLAASMKTAIRFVKQEVSRIDIQLSDDDAKALLLERVDTFVRERVTLAGQAIANYGLSKIGDGDVIVTYARSSTVLQVLCEAFDRGVRFRVVVVDAKPRYEGREMLRSLSEYGVPCTYVALSGLAYVIKEGTKVILGAAAVLSNGAVMSRVGTAVVAMAAHENKVPVIFCCETLKFSDNVRLDSFVWNEIGDPDELVHTTTRSTRQLLPSFLPRPTLCSQSSGAAPYVGAGTNGLLPPAPVPAGAAPAAGGGKGRTGGKARGGAAAPVAAGDGSGAIAMSLTPLVSPGVASAALTAPGMPGPPSAASACAPGPYQLQLLGANGSQQLLASSRLVGVNVTGAASRGATPGDKSHATGAPAATCLGSLVGGSSGAGGSTFIAGGGTLDNVSGLLSTGTFVSSSLLASWRDIDALKLLNLQYDVTPARFISLVISEVGLIPSTSATTVLHDAHLAGIQ